MYVYSVFLCMCVCQFSSPRYLYKVSIILFMHSHFAELLEQNLLSHVLYLAPLVSAVREILGNRSYRKKAGKYDFETDY